MEARHSIFTEYLHRLGVPCTVKYSDRAFANMPFSTLFGFGKLLGKYGIANEAYLLTDREEVASLPVPYLAQYRCSFVVVDAVNGDKYSISDGERCATVSTAEFMRNFGGNVLLAYPDEHSCEPGYCKHRFINFAMRARRWVLTACVLFIGIYLIVTNGLYRSWSAMASVAIYTLGLYASYLLTLKSSGIKSEAGDAICGVIERTGCHTVLGTGASKFFGIFGWSEVGLGYFGVSLATLLMFPEYSGELALANALCCPFSFWSVWYQRFRAHAWCTLCLTVQGCLWVALICQLAGGWLGQVFPIRLSFFVLIASYMAAVLAANAVAETFTKILKNDE